MLDGGEGVEEKKEEKREMKNEALKKLKLSANQDKSGLIRLSDMVRQVSPREAERLDKIIYKLEHWQNS